MVDAIIFIAVVALIIALAVGVARGSRSSRFAEMTEEEYNREAERVTMRGAGVAEFQRIVDPSHKVEYLQQRDKHVQAEEVDSGDRPDTSERKTDERRSTGERHTNQDSESRTEKE